MKHRLLPFLFLSAMLASPGFAADLHSARASGAVGEKPDGYVAPLQNSPQASALAAQVNDKRKQAYARIAKEKGQPVEAVGKIAGQEVIKNLPSGTMYQAPDGSWKKK